MINMDNKRILVSGSSQGLGLKIVETFSKYNSSGFGFDLKENAKDLKGWKFLQIDVSNEKDIINGFEKIKESIGGLDVVVANAGIVPPWRTINDIENDEWEKVFNINVKGVALTIKHSVELMKSSGGSIVVMGSINSLLGHSGQSLYTASKHALLGIVKCAAIDLGKFDKTWKDAYLDTIQTTSDIICSGEIRTSGIAYLDNDYAMSIADGGAVTFKKAVHYPVVENTQSSATLALDLATGNHFQVNLGANVTAINLANSTLLFTKNNLTFEFLIISFAKLK